MTINKLRGLAIATLILWIVAGPVAYYATRDLHTTRFGHGMFWAAAWFIACIGIGISAIIIALAELRYDTDIQPGKSFAERLLVKFTNVFGSTMCMVAAVTILAGILGTTSYQNMAVTVVLAGVTGLSVGFLLDVLMLVRRDWFVREASEPKIERKLEPSTA